MTLKGYFWPGFGGSFLLLKIPGEGGFFQDGRGRGAGRVSAANRGIFWAGGGGLNIFFGAEMSTKLHLSRDRGRAFRRERGNRALVTVL